MRASGAHSAARMSFVEVFPVEPVIATTRASLRSRTVLPRRAERRERVVGNERRRGTTRARVREERLAAADRDEEVAGLDAAASRS